jgi:DNA-binding TFAR19-related protein (PDSD5 family)
MQGIIRLVAVSVTGVFVPCALGGESALSTAELRPAFSDRVSSFLAGLDSDEFQARERATAGLARLLDSPQGQSAAESQLSLPQWQSLSYDARRRLAAIGLNAPAVARAVEKKPGTASDLDVAVLVKRLASDRYLDRAEAQGRLHDMARRSATIQEYYPALKKAAADPALSLDARLTLELLLDSARHTWLTSPEHKRTSPSSAAQVASWISNLTAPDKDEAPAENAKSVSQSIAAKRNLAERELLDALTQAEAAPLVQSSVEAAIVRGSLDDDALARLQRLREWARPGLAAEYWQRRENLTVQFFVVGVPSQAPGARRATRFDRVTDEVALCGAGNALSPGQYPLGVAFPHPREQASFFHLVSLPTARERLVYQHQIASVNEAERLAEVTRRTLGPSLAKSRPLDDAQLWLLGQLDQPTVASMLREYFAGVPDEPFDMSQLAPMLSDVSSVHRTACLMLALDGSHEVVPALVDAAKKRRFMSLSIDEPQAMAWIAALAIAAREPWEGVDRWLAGLVHCQDRISFGQLARGEVGATAAAMLLLRNDLQPREFGLAAREPLQRGLHDRFEAPINADYRRRMFEDRMFKQLGLTPYTFIGDDARIAVAQWCADRQPAAAPSTPISAALPPTISASAPPR